MEKLESKHRYAIYGEECTYAIYGKDTHMRTPSMERPGIIAAALAAQDELNCQTDDENNGNKRRQQPYTPTMESCFRFCWIDVVRHWLLQVWIVAVESIVVVYACSAVEFVVAEAGAAVVVVLVYLIFWRFRLCCRCYPLSVAVPVVVASEYVVIFDGCRSCLCCCFCCRFSCCRCFCCIVAHVVVVPVVVAHVVVVPVVVASVVVASVALCCSCCRCCLLCPRCRCSCCRCSCCRCFCYRCSCCRCFVAHVVVVPVVVVAHVVAHVVVVPVLVAHVVVVPAVVAHFVVAHVVVAHVVVAHVAAGDAAAVVACWFSFLKLLPLYSTRTKFNQTSQKLDKKALRIHAPHVK